MDFRTFNLLADRADVDIRSYSGRGMAGRYCAGTTECPVDMAIRIMREAMDYGDVDLDEVQYALSNYRQDSMGLGRITYWPGIKWEGAINDEDE